MTTFYIVGTIYFVISLLVMIGLGVGIWIAYRKIQQLEAEVKAKLNVERLQAQAWENIVPMAVNASLGFGAKMLKNKFFPEKKSRSA